MIRSLPRIGKFDPGKPVMSVISVIAAQITVTVICLLVYRLLRYRPSAYYCMCFLKYVCSTYRGDIFVNVTNA